MKTAAITFILSVMIIGCNTNDDNPQNASIYANSLELSVRDSQGNDLLDPNSPNSFKKKDIKLYYLIDGQKQEVLEANLDNPRNFTIYNKGEELKNSDGYIIKIVTNISESDEFPITYVQWNESDTDTVKTEYRRTPNMILLTKAWYNGKLMYDWDASGHSNPNFEITK